MSSTNAFKLLIVLAIALAGYFLYTLDIFKSAPISLQAHIHLSPTKKLPLDSHSAWNPDKRISITISSASKLKSYKIRAITNEGVVLLDQEEIISNRPETLDIWLPRPPINLPSGTAIHYEISVTDWSNANFFRGTTLVKHFDFLINTKRPIITIIAHSPRITYGGSAMVVFRVESIDIKQIHISNGTNSFIPFPFVAPGYYATIIAWPLSTPNFNAKITATDTALNTRTIALPIIKNPPPHYKDSTITLHEQFFHDKMEKLIAEIHTIRNDDLRALSDDFSRFVYINEKVRNDDEAIISKRAKEASINDAKELHFEVAWNPFIPIRGYSVVGQFGDNRTYINAEGKISKSLHLGLDVASVKNDKIRAPNDGQVILEEKLGVYGDTMMLYHGFGLTSLYSHLSSFIASKDHVVTTGDIIGLTGESGWAFGDHLHFGMLVQGLNVRNVEWLDARWIKSNITDVLAKAKAAITANQAR